MTDRDDDELLHRDGLGARFLYSIVLLILFSIAANLLWIIALGQILWMLTSGGRPNDGIAEFGARLGVWMQRVLMYISAAVHEKPFPWREID